MIEKLRAFSPSVRHSSPYPQSPRKPTNIDPNNVAGQLSSMCVGTQNFKCNPEISARGNSHQCCNIGRNDSYDRTLEIGRNGSGIGFGYGPYKANGLDFHMSLNAGLTAQEREEEKDAYDHSDSPHDVEVMTCCRSNVSSSMPCKSQSDEELFLLDELNQVSSAANCTRSEMSPPTVRPRYSTYDLGSLTSKILSSPGSCSSLGNNISDISPMHREDVLALSIPMMNHSKSEEIFHGASKLLSNALLSSKSDTALLSPSASIFERRPKRLLRLPIFKSPEIQSNESEPSSISTEKTIRSLDSSFDVNCRDDNHWHASILSTMSGSNSPASIGERRSRGSTYPGGNAYDVGAMDRFWQNVSSECSTSLHLSMSESDKNASSQSPRKISNSRPLPDQSAFDCSIR
jgi:hypothetical protein